MTQKIFERFNRFCHKCYSQIWFRYDSVLFSSHHLFLTSYDTDPIFFRSHFKSIKWCHKTYIILYRKYRPPFDIKTSVIMLRHYEWAYFKCLLINQESLSSVQSWKIKKRIRIYLLKNPLDVEEINFSGIENERITMNVQ